MITPKTLPRIFRYKGRDLGDPNPNTSPEGVRQILTLTFPELANAQLIGPELNSRGQIYEFQVQIGSKG